MGINLKFNVRTLVKGFSVPLIKRAIILSEVTHKVLTEDRETFANGDKAGNQSEGRSALGTPVYGTLSIKEPKHNKFIFDKKKGEYVETPVEFPFSNKEIGTDRYMYIEGCIIEVTQDRNIVTTSISGEDGEVKEFINNGDYNVTINGFFASIAADIYPENEVKALTQYLTAPIPLEVVNTYLNTYFGISTLVVMSYNFRQTEGMRNVQYFTINCKSDKAFEATEIENT